jgi:carbon monoxide dehydrogenase subunit G
MDFAGEYRIPASPDRVWAAINDPDILRGCIPGCESMEKTSANEFLASARLKIGPVSATFKGKVALSELDPPNRCILTGEGQGGVAGFAKGGAEIRLVRDGSGTVLHYTAKANVGGKLAQIGQRLIDGAAKQIADDFFRRFVAVLSESAPGEPVAEPMPESPANAPPSAKRDGVAPEVWVIGLIAVVAILLSMFALAR